MLYLPEGLPAAAVLREEGLPVATYRKPEGGKCLPERVPQALRIVLLNLMPQKAVTELDIARVLAHVALPVQLIPMKLAGQTYKTTPQEYMERFYTDEEVLLDDAYDGMILTGAPIEHLPFEEVRYWPQLCRVMEWAKTRVRSTLYICWGAQAGLYYHFRIPKYQLNAKLFGIFPQQVLAEDEPLFEGLYPEFPMPNSRHTEVRREDFPQEAGVTVAAAGAASGIAVALGHGGREIFITGHLEYEPDTLHHEYVRDKNKGLPIALPENYYVDDLPERGVRFSWKAPAIRFYRNWVERYCAAGR